MARCGACGEDVDELHSMKIGGKRKKLCEDCLELAQEQAEIAEMGEEAMRDMMGYKGKW